MTRVEVLGFPGFGSLTRKRQDSLEAIIASSVEVLPDNEIILRAITLRRLKKMSLGDSLIAATALEYGVPLVTRNDSDFKHIVGLVIINPFATSTL